MDIRDENIDKTDYEKWVEQKIDAALTKKRDGTATYKQLSEVAEQYNFDAR